MTHTLRNIIGFAASSAFLLAATFNAQLVWNADKFYAPQQEVVQFDGKSYSINEEYNELLKSRHTDLQTKAYSEGGHKSNVRALSRFFGMIN